MEDLKNIEKLLSDNSDKINGSVSDKNKLKSENKSVKKSVNNDCILNGYHKECLVGIK